MTVCQVSGNNSEYHHVFDDGKRSFVVSARLYPNNLMTEFNLQLDDWIRNGKALEYFSKKDQKAIAPLKEAFSELPPLKKKLSEFNNSLKKALEYKPKD